MEIKNLKKAAERIISAVKDKEKIILYGDGDLDGVTSVVILKETIMNLGGETTAVYFPNREKEGYGISETALSYLKKFSPALFISMDLGITNFKEAKIAKKLGFELIIVDHHEVVNELPEAEIVIDPKQPGDEYQFKDLASAGIVFKLSELILQEKMTAILRKNFIELTAVATIADMMPQEGENKLIIKEGKAELENSWRPGIKSFFQFEEIKSLSGLEQRIAKLVSVLNVRDIKNRQPASYKLLTAASPEAAQELAGELFLKQNLRKKEMNDMQEAVEKEISGNEAVIFAGGPDFEFTLIPPVASILCQKYRVPTFIYKKLEKESVGTVRMPPGVNAVELMKKCAEHLLTFGGHPPAAGFRLLNENLEKFRECLIKNVQ